MQTLKKPDITMFFPAYNEEENIPIIITSADEVLKKFAGSYEIIIVVYEGSKDSSINVVREFEKKNKNVRLVLQPKDMKGIGTAIKIGFENARYPYVFYADSDNQFNLNEFEKFLPYIDDYDVIAGYRIKRRDPLTRIWVSKIYNIMMKLIFNVKEKDLDCAFRLVNKKVISSINLICSTGVATTELLAKAGKKGFRIMEIGVSHYPRTLGKPVFELEVGLNLPKPKVVSDIFKDIFFLWNDIKNIRRK